MYATLEAGKLLSNRAQTVGRDLERTSPLFKIGVTMHVQLKNLNIVATIDEISIVRSRSVDVNSYLTISGVLYLNLFFS